MHEIEKAAHSAGAPQTVEDAYMISETRLKRKLELARRRIDLLESVLFAQWAVLILAVLVLGVRV